MFEPLRTSRLLIRAPGPHDAKALAAWRNDPAVAVFQDWTVPFPLDLAESRIAGQPEVPTDGAWWTAIVEEQSFGAAVGELVVHLTNGARTAEVGYTLARASWGRGYAVEGLAALVAHLFDAFPLTRAWGGLHPENRASAMVLERVGMLFEGHTRLSYWLGEENSDDWIYGMTRADWAQWRDRPRDPPEVVRLVPVTPANVRAVRSLHTHHSQRAFVAPVLDSLADAMVPDIVNGAPVVPWLRAIEADDELVGFVMLALVTPAHPDPYLWRLLIDRRHQRRSIATRSLELVVAQCRSWGAEALITNWVEGKGSPRPFYLAHGFVTTGRVDDNGETEGRLAIPHAH